MRLGHGGGDMKELSAEAIDRASPACSGCGGIADSYDATLRAVATSADREATNAASSSPRAARGRGRHRGDLRGRGGPADPPRRAAGGAGVRPTPAARRHRRRVDRAADRRARRDARRPQLQARRRPPHRPLLPRRARSAPTRSRPAASTCAASSSTSSARSRRTASRSRSPRRARPRRSPGWSTRATGAEPLRTYNCFEFTEGALDDVVAELCRAPHRRRRGTKVAGLEAQRADIIVAGALILATIAATFGVESFTFSEAALRDGVLLDTISRRRGGRRARTTSATCRGAASASSSSAATTTRRTRPTSPASPSSCSTARRTARPRPRRRASTSRPARCWPTSGSSSPTASTTCTPTT